MPKPRYLVFRIAWWSSNLLLVLALLVLAHNGAQEFSVRRYLDGYSDAIVPKVVPAEEKVDAILNWMRAEPSRGITENPETLPERDPETTLIYAKLLRICGTATNAFLNLARASDLQVRRLLLLSPDRKTKHVVAEVMIDRRWVVVDPTYRAIMKDADGHLLTRKELQDPAIFKAAAGAIPNYPLEYNYEHIAHVRLERLPGRNLLRYRDSVIPLFTRFVEGRMEMSDLPLLGSRPARGCQIMLVKCLSD